MPWQAGARRVHARRTARRRRWRRFPATRSRNRRRWRSRASPPTGGGAPDPSSPPPLARSVRPAIHPRDRRAGTRPRWRLDDRGRGRIAARRRGHPARRVAWPRRADSAVHAAAALGYPVALKALGPTLLHKTERRAVALNLSDDAALRAAFEDFSNRFAGEMTSVLVQRMVPAGVEMIVGRAAGSAVRAADRLRNRRRARGLLRRQRVPAASPHRTGCASK